MQRRNDEVLFAEATLFRVRLYTMRVDHLRTTVAHQCGKLHGLDDIVGKRVVANAASWFLQCAQWKDV